MEVQHLLFYPYFENQVQKPLLELILGTGLNLWI